MTLLDIFSYIIDLLLILVYLDRTLYTRKSNIPTPAFYISFICAESVLMINQICFHSPQKHLSIFITSILSIITIFALCFLYQSTLIRKIIYSIIFQLFAMLSEYTFTLIIRIISPTLCYHL